MLGRGAMGVLNVLRDLLLGIVAPTVAPRARAGCRYIHDQPPFPPWNLLIT